MHGLGLPDWVLSATVTGLVIGLALTLVLAWAFDLKGGRIERTGPAPRIASSQEARRPAEPQAQAASIAVLPFADLSPAKDQDWMCDGIAEEIIDRKSTRLNSSHSSIS